MTIGLSTTVAAELSGVSVKSVTSWIDKGLLHAMRSPSGRRRLLPAELGRFLYRQGRPIPAELASAPATVLVVDDNPGCGQWLSLEFADRYPGCRVQVASNGFEAGKLFGMDWPQLVMLDLRMPGMDGFEVCRNIRRILGGDATSVIAMSADSSIETEQAVLQCGADGYLPKPLEIEELFAMAEAQVGWRLKQRPWTEVNV